MLDKTYTEKENKAFGKMLTSVGGPVQEVIHDALQKNDVTILNQAEKILSEELEDLDHQNAIENKIKYENSFVGQGFRGASWLFSYSNGRDLFNYELGSSDKWKSKTRFNGIRCLNTMNEKTVQVLDDKIFTATRNIRNARIDQKDSPTIPRPIYTASFYLQGTWVVNDSKVYYINQQNRRKTEFKLHLSGITTPRIQFICADHVRNILFLVTNNQLWRSNIRTTLLKSSFTPNRISEPKLIKTFNQFKSFKDVQYSEKLRMLFFVPSSGQNVYAYHTETNLSLRIGKETSYIKIPAPIRPYRGFSIQCMLHINTLEGNHLRSIFGGDGMPNVYIRPKDSALVFRWYAPENLIKEPLIDVAFPNVFKDCIGKWISLTLCMGSRGLEIYCNGTSFKQPLNEIYPTWWNGQPSDLIIGTLPPLSNQSKPVPSADFCIAELRVWDHVLDQNEAKKDITSWIIGDHRGLPKKLRCYYRFDMSRVASFHHKQESFHYNLGTELVQKLNHIENLDSADWLTINPPAFYDNLIKVAEPIYGKILSNLSVCECSQQLFWVEDKNNKSTALVGSSAHLAGRTDFIELLEHGTTLLSSKWQGFTHLQYLTDAKNRQQSGVELGNDLVHAARMQTYLELTWMQKENDDRITEAKIFRKNDITINQHFKTHKRYLEVHDEKRKIREEENRSVKEQIQNAKVDARDKIRNARSEAIRRRSQN